MKKTKLYVMDNGEMWIDKRILLAGAGNATASNRNPPAVWDSIPMQTFLIEHPDGPILFDTACNPEGMASRWPEWIKEISPYTFTEAQLPLNRLAALGYKPSDIKDVVVSHLHVDHGGCLEYFKDSRIIVSDAEITNTMRNYVVKDELDVHMRCDIEQWIKADLHWYTLSDDVEEVELRKGVRILNLGSGHSWGMLALLVDLPDTGKVLLSSDALYTADNLGPPVRLPGIVLDTVGYRKTAVRLKQIADREHATIWFGHDKAQFSMLTKSDVGHYE